MLSMRLSGYASRLREIIAQLRTKTRAEDREHELGNLGRKPSPILLFATCLEQEDGICAGGGYQLVEESVDGPPPFSETSSLDLQGERRLTLNI